jgi:hypothetical protein
MPRRGTLVSEHLENVSGDLLRRHRAAISAFVRGRHGIYALYRDERLYYVGLASNLRSRLTQHLRDRHSGKWDRFSIYLTVDNTHLNDLETLFLRMMLPRGNRNRGSFANSTDLKPRLEAGLIQSVSELLHRRSRVPPTPRNRTRRGNTSPRTSTMAPFVSAPFEIRIQTKSGGQTISAQVNSEGMISLRGRTYSSPSTAGQVVLGRPCAGWNAWKFEQSPGRWVYIDELRRGRP